MLTSINTRIHLDISFGTSISCVLDKATSVHPKDLLAATAGYSAVRSFVVVKKAAAISSTFKSFSLTIDSNSSLDASIIDSLSLLSAVVAPLIPRHAI